MTWDISHGMTQKARNFSVFFRVFPWQNRTEATHTTNPKEEFIK